MDFNLVDLADAKAAIVLHLVSRSELSSFRTSLPERQQRVLESSQL